jgi:hypothetical protein
MTDEENRKIAIFMKVIAKVRKYKKSAISLVFCGEKEM